MSTGDLEPVYGAPEPVAVNSEFIDEGADLATDGLTLFFSSRRPGSAGYWDLWTATRSAKGEPFTNPVPIHELNGPGFDAHPSISADMLTLYYDREAVWVATRDNVGDAWSNPHALPGYGGHNGPSVNAEQTRLVTQAAPEGNWDLFEGVAAVPGEFGLPSPISELNTAFGEAHPDLSEDGLTLYFESDRPPSLGWDLYVSKRASINDPFGPPERIEALSTPNREGMPGISPDGTELFYSDGPDIYRVEIAYECQ